MRAALRRHSLNALDLFPELEGALVATDGQEGILPLGEAINALRFEEALNLLQALAPAAQNGE